MASQNVQEFTSENWEREVEQSDVPVLVDFWAPWCGPCRALGPTIDKVATQFAGKVKVGKLNVDDAPDVATKFGINTIPRVFTFKGGDKPREKAALLAKAAEYLVQAGDEATAAILSVAMLLGHLGLEAEAARVEAAVAADLADRGAVRSTTAIGDAVITRL